MRRNQGTAQRLRDLEGRHVSVALTDGSRLDDCELVSAGHDRTQNLWLYDGNDIFVPLDDVTDLWEVMAPRVSPRAW